MLSYIKCYFKFISSKYFNKLLNKVIIHQENIHIIGIYLMDNNKAIKYREQLPSLNNFNIKELYSLPQYFGWVDYEVNKENKICMFLGGNDDGVALRCFWNSQYEKKTLQIWAELSLIEGIILDIGAHSGIYSLTANKSIIHGAVLSFEPHYLNFSRLNLNLRANGFSTKTIFMNAVGQRNEMLPFSANQNIDYLTSGGKIGKIKNQKSTPIQTIAIDNFLDGIAKKNVKVIKIDVEGYEYHCLLGLLETIKSSNPIIFFECMSQKNNTEIELFLKNKKYIIFIVNDIEGSINLVENLFPVFDKNNNIVHEKINRIAVPETKIDMFNKIFK